MQPSRERGICLPNFVEKWLTKIFSRATRDGNSELPNFYCNTNIQYLNVLEQNKTFRIPESDIMAFSYSEGGAMGMAHHIEVMTSPFIVYYLDYFEVSEKRLYKIMPILKDCRFGYDNAADLPHGYCHYYIGAGNHLAIKDIISLSCKSGNITKTKQLSLFSEFYRRRYEDPMGDWIKIINKILNEELDDLSK